MIKTSEQKVAPGQNKNSLPLEALKIFADKPHEAGAGLTDFKVF